MSEPAREVRRRWRVWYLGEAWAVIDDSNDPWIIYKDRDYASYWSAARAAKRLNEREAAAHRIEREAAA